MSIPRLAAMLAVRYAPRAIARTLPASSRYIQQKILPHLPPVAAAAYWAMMQRAGNFAINPPAAPFRKQDPTLVIPAGWSPVNEFNCWWSEDVGSPDYWGITTDGGTLMAPSNCSIVHLSPTSDWVPNQIYWTGFNWIFGQQRTIDTVFGDAGFEGKYKRAWVYPDTSGTLNPPLPQVRGEVGYIVNRVYSPTMPIPYDWFSTPLLPWAPWLQPVIGATPMPQSAPYTSIPDLNKVTSPWLPQGRTSGNNPPALPSDPPETFEPHPEVPPTAKPAIKGVYPPAVGSAISEPAWHELRPPRKGEKERKVKASRVAVVRVADAISEGVDAVNAFYKAVPKHMRPRYITKDGKTTRHEKRNLTPDEKAEVIYDNLLKMHDRDILQGLLNIALTNQLDKLYGTIGRNNHTMGQRIAQMQKQFGLSL